MNLIPWRQKRQDNGGQLLPVSGLRSEMDRLFDSFFTELPAWGPAIGPR